MSSLLKNLLFALGLALILWLGYMVFIQEDEPALESSSGMAAGAAERQAQEFLGRLQQLKGYRVDGKIFDDPRFNSLVNLRQDLGEEPTGRDNPFAPIE